LEKAGKKENLYQAVINKTKELEKSSSDLRSFILKERNQKFSARVKTCRHRLGKDLSRVR